MTIDRRDFLKVTAAAGFLASSASLLAAPKVKAVAFDAFPIFDPRPVFRLADELAPGLANEWRTRQFEYTWLRTLTRQYADFWRVTEDALTAAARKLGVDLDAERRGRLMQGYLELQPWPDVVPALKTLRSAGIRLAFLSNFTPNMLASCIRASGLDGVFEHVLSTDRVKAFKPDPRAYQMGLDAFHLRRDEIAFAAFAGWDAAGARTFGYPTFWVNRLNAAPEELGVSPDATGKELGELVRFVGA